MSSTVGDYMHSARIQTGLSGLRGAANKIIKVDLGNKERI